MRCVTALCLLMSGWLTQHGYGPTHRDAVLNYVAAESGFQPDVIGASGVCLFQWTGVRRRTALVRGGGRCPGWEMQLEQADAELRGPFAGFWRSRDPTSHMRRHFGAGALDP